MKKYQAPHRQRRGPRATKPPEPPGPPCRASAIPEISKDPWWAHDHGFCPCWHQYDECPCALVDHVEAHLAAGCPCPS